MKTLIFTRKVLAIFIMAICFLFSPKMIAQTIQIDSLFTTDGEIFPFGPNDTIYGLSISGSVTLLSDTSLVRVILTDNSGQEWMVYEAYPMIVEDTSFDFVEECDETCYLNGIVPNSLQIQLSRATFDFDSLNKNKNLINGIENLIIDNAHYKDSLKIEAVNEYINKTHMPWAAGSTKISIMSYAEKKIMFGYKYKLYGYDYYSGGIYNPFPFIPCIKDNSPLVNKFDWRKKHNAHLATSKYWDHDPDTCPTCTQGIPEHGNGWMTMVKDQALCSNQCTGCCYIFGPLGVMEAITNLYFNYHYDLDLSEQYTLNCTQDGCTGGSPSNTVDFTLNEEGAPNRGIVDDNSLPWAYGEQMCDTDIEFAYKFSIHGKKDSGDGRDYPSIEELKQNLLAHGPLDVSIHIPGYSLGHNLVLVGYGILEENDVFHSWDGLEFKVSDYPQYIGCLYWICKNSYNCGPDSGADGFSGDGGYFYFINVDDYNNFYYQIKDWIYLEPPVYIEDNNPNVDYIRHCYDKDKDGYFNWGLGEFDANLCDPPCGDDREDSNDDDNRIGYYDDNYYGTSIMPELKVLHLSNIQRNYIENNSFFSFSSGDLDEDNKLSFYIENTGTGQLNLRDFGFSGERPVKIINVEGGSQNYSISDIDQPQINICWGYENKSEFKIYFNGSIQGELTKIKIYLDENKEIPDFEFILVHNDCLPATQLIPISRDESWDTYALKNDDYLITGGATVTVTGEIALVENSDIFVDRGSKLVINGGKLTSTCGSLWNGVDIWGNASLPQISTYQGMVQIINGGTIEFAKTAISTSRINGIYTIPSGGIVSCCDAIFKDNMKDVEFYPFTNTHPVTHAILPNFSRFTRTRFETTDDLHNIFGADPDRHLAMDGVGGIYILACTFDNNSTRKANSRGIGIESNQSGYTIGSECTEGNVIPCPEWQPCRFENLEYGVRAFNSNSRYTITVDSADFIDNYRGIFMSIVYDASIIRNRFELNADEDYFEPGETLVGIYAERCTRYQIEENKITGRDPDHFELLGMQIVNSGADYYNEIYNDSLINLTSGITAAGENRNKDGSKGLCIKCNDFVNCITDVYITPEGGYNPDFYGIATDQGFPGSAAPQGVDPNSMGAGNTFTSDNYTSLLSNFNNKDGLDQINYTHQLNSGLFKIVPNPYNNLKTIEDGETYYTKDGSCPSHLHAGGIQLESEKIILLDETSQIYSYLDTLNQYIDGGDTPGLNFEVQSSFPDNALEIRQELLDQSPYLSDTVMKSAISKENVFPNAMVRDILVANPQAPKSAGILVALENKNDPIPDYMLVEIMEGKNILGGKEQLERKLAMHNSLRASSFSNITHFYKNDTLLTSSQDSLLAFLEQDYLPETHYQLAFCKLNSGDTLELLDLLNNIPVEFSFNEDQWITHSLYESLFDILIEIQSDSTGIESNTSVSLTAIADETNVIPGIYARNLLINNSLLYYSELVYLPEYLKTSRVWDKTHISYSPKSTYLKIYPNPAGTFFIIEYDLRNIQGKAFIKILDLTGREVSDLYLTDLQNQRIVDTRNLSNGTYLVKLIIKKNVTEVHKVNIAK